MKKYGSLEEYLKKEFGSVRKFSKESTIPNSTISMMISGKYGNEEQAKKRIEAAIRQYKPGADLCRIWDVTEEYHQKYLLTLKEAKKGFRITIDVSTSDGGEMLISPRVEGF
jgi:hypothetical protein